MAEWEEERERTVGEWEKEEKDVPLLTLPQWGLGNDPSFLLRMEANLASTC